MCVNSLDVIIKILTICKQKMFANNEERVLLKYIYRYFNWLKSNRNRVFNDQPGMEIMQITKKNCKLKVLFTLMLTHNHANRAFKRNCDDFCINFVFKFEIYFERV